MSKPPAAKLSAAKRMRADGMGRCLSVGTKPLKSYEEPALEKLTPEQAKKFLLRHANMGDEGAKKILEIVLPTSTNPK